MKKPAVHYSPASLRLSTGFRAYCRDVTAHIWTDLVLYVTCKRCLHLIVVQAQQDQEEAAKAQARNRQA